MIGETTSSSTSPMRSRVPTSACFGDAKTARRRRRCWAGSAADRCAPGERSSSRARNRRRSRPVRHRSSALRVGVGLDLTAGARARQPGVADARRPCAAGAALCRDRSCRCARDRDCARTARCRGRRRSRRRGLRRPSALRRATIDRIPVERSPPCQDASAALVTRAPLTAPDDVVHAERRGGGRRTYGSVRSVPSRVTFTVGCCSSRCPRFAVLAAPWLRGGRSCARDASCQRHWRRGGVDPHRDRSPACSRVRLSCSLRRRLTDPGHRRCVSERCGGSRRSSTQLA